MNESQRSSQVLKILRDDYDCFAFKFSDRYTSGIPDSVIIAPAKRELWVEFKGEETHLTPLQKNTIRKMRDKDANVFLVRFTGPKEFEINGIRKITYQTSKQGVGLLLRELLSLSGQGEDVISKNTS